MSNEIVVALIGLSGSTIGSIIGIMASSKLTQYRLSELEKKVDKHNTVIERTYKLEEGQALAEQQFKVINHRLQDLESEVHHE